ILAARRDVALDHDADDTPLAVRKLRRDLADDGRLILRALQAVRVTRIDHEARGQPCLLQQLASRGDVLSAVVRRLAAAQDHVPVRIAGRGGYGCLTFLGHGQEMMWVRRRANRIHGDFHVAVRAVLEAHGARQTRRHLTMDLALGRARADRATRYEIRAVLPRGPGMIPRASRAESRAARDARSRRWSRSARCTAARAAARPAKTAARSCGCVGHRYGAAYSFSSPYWSAFPSGTKKAARLAGGFRVFSRSL